MAGPEVTAKLGLDTAPFKRALTGSSADVEKFGNQAARGLERSFGAHHIGKAVVAAFGLNDIEKAANTIARFITGVSEDTEKAYKSIEESSQKHADFVIEQMEREISAEKRYQLLLKERDKALKNPDAVEGPGVLEKVSKFLGASGGGAFNLLGQYARNKEGERATQIQANAGKAQERADELQKRANAAHKESGEDTKKLTKENLDYEKEFWADVEEGQEKKSKALEKEKKKKEEILAITAEIAERESTNAYDKKKLSDEKLDRGRLTIKQLATFGRFSSGADQSVTEGGEVARQILELRSKASEAQRGGKIGETNDLLSRADDLARGLQGTIKGSEADPFAEATQTLKRSEDELKKLNTKLAEVVSDGS